MTSDSPSPAETRQDQLAGLLRAALAEPEQHDVDAYAAELVTRPDDLRNRALISGLDSADPNVRRTFAAAWIATRPATVDGGQ